MHNIHIISKSPISSRHGVAPAVHSDAAPSPQGLLCPFSSWCPASDKIPNAVIQCSSDELIIVNHSKP